MEEAKEAPKKRQKRDRDFNHDHACGLCDGQPFSRRDKLINHWRVKHKKELASGVCPFTSCGYERPSDDMDPNRVAIHCWHVHGVPGMRRFRCNIAAEECRHELFGSLSELWEHEWVKHGKNHEVLFDVTNGKMIKTIPEEEAKKRASSLPTPIFVDQLFKPMQRTKRACYSGTEAGLMTDLGTLFGDLAATTPDASFAGDDDGT